MYGFEEFLAGKAKVMGESSKASAEDFSPLSNGATSSSQNRSSPFSGSQDSSGTSTSASQPSFVRLFIISFSLVC